MQTIALICTDDTGEGVLEKPEEPDERFDDMTLISKLASRTPLLAQLTFALHQQYVPFPSHPTGPCSSITTSARRGSNGTSTTAKASS